MGDPSYRECCFFMPLINSYSPKSQLFISTLPHIQHNITPLPPSKSPNAKHPTIRVCTFKMAEAVMGRTADMNLIAAPPDPRRSLINQSVRNILLHRPSSEDRSSKRSLHRSRRSHTKRQSSGRSKSVNEPRIWQSEADHRVTYTHPQPQLEHRWLSPVQQQ